MASAVTCLFLAAAVLLSHFPTGLAAPATPSTAASTKKQPSVAACSASNLVITQSKTGNVVEGKPEYEVTVVNRCRCSQAKVTARCYGLSSVRPVDPRAIRPVDDELCVVNRGKPVIAGGKVRFRYAWMTPQDFPIVSTQIQC